MRETVLPKISNCPPIEVIEHDNGTIQFERGGDYDSFALLPAELAALDQWRGVGSLGESAKLVQECRNIIEIFHGKAGWEEYQESPEMKRINNFIAAIERRNP